MQSESADRPRMLSAVIPVFSEVESIVTLHGELSAVAQSTRATTCKSSLSTTVRPTASWEQICQLAAADPTHGLSACAFRRNFGKAAALTLPVSKRPVASW